MVYTHGSHVPSDSLIGDILTRSRRSAPPLGSLSDAPRRGRRGYFARRAVRRWGTSGGGLSWRTRWRMKPRASQPQNHSPCPRASPCSVLTGRRPGPRSGRAGARPSRFTVVRPAPRAGRRGRRPLPPILLRRGPAREGLAPPSARGVRTGPARDVPRREGRNSLRPGQEGILPVNTERAETRRHGGG